MGVLYRVMVCGRRKPRQPIRSLPPMRRAIMRSGNSSSMALRSSTMALGTKTSGVSRVGISIRSSRVTACCHSRILPRLSLGTTKPSTWRISDQSLSTAAIAASRGRTNRIGPLDGRPPRASMPNSRFLRLFSPCCTSISATASSRHTTSERKPWIFSLSTTSRISGRVAGI